MMWNWQEKDWPRFDYAVSDLTAYEDRFLHNAGTLQGSLKHISDADKQGLRIELISEEALKTSEIEGEMLSRDSLHSSIGRHFGLKTDHRKISPAEQGISEMLLDLYRSYANPLDHKTLFDWHIMLTNGRRDLQDIGRYRTHTGSMQVISHTGYRRKVHYEAPPTKDVQNEMNAFIDWFNSTGQGSNKPLPALTRAGIAHIYFESIHPFEDGNGRIGRAISEQALSQSLGRPTLIALAHSMEQRRKAYYAALRSASKGLDIQDWLEFFCQTVLDAQDYTQSMIDFLIEKGRFYQRFANTINARQAKAIKRMFEAGIEGFKGGLSAENYISITQTSRATTTRDLHNLVGKGAFTRTGERKHTRYFLNIDHASTKSKQ